MKDTRVFRTVISVTVLLSIAAGAAGQGKAPDKKPRKGHFVDVRTYLPKGYVTDGSVDYREQIQKCFDENAYVYFPGSNDHKKPVNYGATAKPLTPGTRRRPSWNQIAYQEISQNIGMKIID